MPVGSCRIFTGGAIQKLVYIGLGVEALGMDSHMLFAFSAPESAVPHFTLDSVKLGDHYAFHLDLIPRVELGVELGYMQRVYGGLNPVLEAVRKTPGLQLANVKPEQCATMSPWMLAYRASEEAFLEVRGAVTSYREQWQRLDQAELLGLLGERWTAHSLRERDRRQREVLFNPTVDPVWHNIDRLLGVETSRMLRETLIRQAVEQV